MTSQISYETSIDFSARYLRSLENNEIIKDFYFHDGVSNYETNFGLFDLDYNTLNLVIGKLLYEDSKLFPVTQGIFDKTLIVFSTKYELDLFDKFMLYYEICGKTYYYEKKIIKNFKKDDYQEVFLCTSENYNIIAKDIIRCGTKIRRCIIMSGNYIDNIIICPETVAKFTWIENYYDSCVNNILKKYIINYDKKYYINFGRHNGTGKIIIKNPGNHINIVKNNFLDLLKGMSIERQQIISEKINEISLGKYECVICFENIKKTIFLNCCKNFICNGCFKNINNNCKPRCPFCTEKFNNNVLKIDNKNSNDVIDSDEIDQILNKTMKKDSLIIIDKNIDNKIKDYYMSLRWKQKIPCKILQETMFSDYNIQFKYIVFIIHSSVTKDKIKEISKFLLKKHKIENNIIIVQKY